MAGQQAGEHDARARRSELAQRHSEPCQRSEQDIGEDQLVWRMRDDGLCAGASST